MEIAPEAETMSDIVMIGIIWASVEKARMGASAASSSAAASSASAAVAASS